MTYNRRLSWPIAVIVLVCITGGLFSGGCQPTVSPEPTAPPEPAAPPDETQPPIPLAYGYLSTNQRLIEGVTAEEIDLRDVDAVFWCVFSQLPDQVVVYPSENYYYYILYINGRQMWGNIRPAAGYRERGILSFAYFEFAEFTTTTNRFTRAKLYTEEDGVNIEEVDRFTYVVTYNEKSVTFNLHQLSQEPPRLFSLGENEVFVERTFDESGYQFFLIFNEQKNYFLWVLNEEEVITDILEPIGDEGDIFVGQRSGFAFWEDAAHDGRKILVSIRQHSVSRNDYFDGPFDQLADNYAEEVGISEYMQRAFPSVKGRIDKYGYYTDTDRPLRVAISAYSTYYTYSEIIQLVARAKASDDPYRYISHRGAPEPEATTPPPEEPQS